MPEFLTNEQIVLEARKRLSQANWDYLVGASESETTMRRNRHAFDRWGFRPRVLVDVSKIDLATTFLGHHLRIPVILAPVGSMQVFHADGAAGSAKAAGEFGTMHVVSSVTEPSLEDIAAAGEGPKVFQLYIRGDKSWIRDYVDRVKAAGYAGFCLTVDTAVASRRDRAMLSRFVSPSSQIRTNDPRFGAAVTWDLLDEIKAMAGLPFFVKGIACAEDAFLAVEHGVDVIWVSNHGGRQLDHAFGTMDVLPEIVEAVAGRARIILDGGVTRGTDVLKALAIGADAVAVGRLQAWGLASAGKDGVVNALNILAAEMGVAMGLLGVTRISDLSPKYVARAESVTPPHEMSAWVNLPGGRVM